MVNRLCAASSEPRSQVRDAIRPSGNARTARERASTTLAVSLPGRRTRSTNRDCRSTKVAMCELRAPDNMSPSQCPGTARSSTSAGRSRIETASMMPPPCCPGPARFDRRIRRRRRKVRDERFLQHAATLHEQTHRRSSRVTPACAGKVRLSHPAICCGDQSAASFPATRARRVAEVATPTSVGTAGAAPSRVGEGRAIACAATMPPHLTADGSTAPGPGRALIPRNEQPRARPREISSRSVNVRATAFAGAAPPRRGRGKSRRAHGPALGRCHPHASTASRPLSSLLLISRGRRTRSMTPPPC